MRTPCELRQTHWANLILYYIDLWLSRTLSEHASFSLPQRSVWARGNRGEPGTGTVACRFQRCTHTHHWSCLLYLDSNKREANRIFQAGLHSFTHLLKVYLGSQVNGMKMKNASLGVNRGQMKLSHFKLDLFSHEQKEEFRTGALFCSCSYLT